MFSLHRRRETESALIKCKLTVEQDPGSDKGCFVKATRAVENFEHE